MKKIGIIGGLAWPSTLDYYRLLCSKTNEHFRGKGATPPYPTPNIVIESLNINETRKLRGHQGDEGSWARYDEIFRSTFRRLKKAGAEFGIIASNTPHMRLKSITQGLDFPIVSILKATGAAVRVLGGKRALILGTSVTMKSAVYPEALHEYGIEALPQLPDKEIADIDKLIDVDLYQGEIADARERILKLCETYLNSPSDDVVCLACTELPLAFPEHLDSAQFKVEGISFVNSTVAHVDAVLKKALV
jgi:aspartate racemase